MSRLQRYFRFRLLTLFVVLTLFSLWLSMHVEGARRQRDAVAALSRPGSAVTFDYQGEGIFDGEWSTGSSANGPKLTFGKVRAIGGAPWLCKFLDKHLVCRVTTVRLHIDDLEDALPALQQLPGLRYVYVYNSRVCSSIGAPTINHYSAQATQIAKELPGVEMRTLSGFASLHAWPDGVPEHSRPFAQTRPAP